MALQDLTPQLRTRLSRLERLVGWFVTLATLLMLVGLGYYVSHLAARKGWFLRKLPYFTFVHSAAGLKVGDRVKLMGFDIGEIIEITPMPPDESTLNVYVRFRVVEPYYGYLWEDSEAKIGATDFLGNRFIEVTKGTNGAATYALQELLEVPVGAAEALVGGTNYFTFAEEVRDTNRNQLLTRQSEVLTVEKLRRLATLGVEKVQVLNRLAPVKNPRWKWDSKAGRYRPFDAGDKGYWLAADESPALTERLERVIDTVEAALPDILALTNDLARAMGHVAAASGRLDALLAGAGPVVTNLALISSNLAGPRGALGEWLLPTNLNERLDATLLSAQAALTNVSLVLTNTDARLEPLLTQLGLSLENLANLTSNLNAQVQANTNLVGSIADAITHTDELVQGLKRHWLLRGAFKTRATNAPPAEAPRRLESPKARGR